jgi:DNA-binding SARP family transcriptional activator/tetratricopeptide (TPR) repeat protein
LGASPSSPTLRIHLFGQPRFSLGDEPFKFAAPPKALPLVAYLLLHRHAPASREKLAFTLWEDETEDDARANLRRHLHHVQRALPAADRATPWVVADSETVQWNPESSYWLDVAEFERLMAKDGGRSRAVDLYAGELLDTLYDEWILTTRDRLRNEYAAALGDLLIEARGARDFARAAGYAQRILTNDPWREDTVRQLMAVRYESADRAGALAVYDQFDRRLREEMNVDPMPETSGLRDIILRNEPLPSGGTSRSKIEAEVGPGTPMLPFVGRAEEMDRLRVQWSRAARGRGGLVLIGGEAGIGKSRLAQEFALVAEAQGARVLTGTTAYPESAPYQALAEALRGAAPLAASLQVSPLWLGVVAQAVPELRARRPDLPIPPKVEPDRERARLFEAISTCLEALAKTRPLVLLLEDLHWAGEATVAAVQYLARRASRLPILLIGTYRDDETSRAHSLRRARRELQEESILCVVSPRPLPREAVAELKSRVPGIADREDSLADVLLDRSAGNPLFLGEVIRVLLEQPGSVADHLPHATKAIGDRIARLPATARSLAEAASVIGRGFNVDLVRDVTGWTENEVLDALSSLIDRHFVRETGGRTGYAYAFTHHLIQSAIYAELDDATRIRRHRHIARLLEDYYAENGDQFAADIARHYDAGRDTKRAAAAYLNAGRHAAALYAYDEAIAHLGRCLELADDATVEWNALAMRERILARRGEREGQRSDLERLSEIARSNGDVAMEWEALHRSALLARSLGERDRERELIEALESKASQSGSARLRAHSMIARAAYATLVADHAAARAAASAALELYRDLGDAIGVVEARCRLVEISSEGGAFEIASAVLEEARRSAVESGDPALVARAMTSATHAAITEQRYDECRVLALEARDVYRTIGDREGEADVIARQASAAARLSLLDEARHCYEDAAAIYQTIGKRIGVAAVLVNGGIHSVRLGLLDEAERMLASSAHHFEALKDARGQTACAVNLSYVKLLRGEASEALSHARNALDLARSIPHAGYEAAALANLGGAERDLGEIDSAIEHMERGVAIRRSLNRPGDYTDDLAHLALVYLMAGRTADAKTMASELAAALETKSAAIFTPQFAYWTAARVFRELGDADRARTTIAQANAIVREQAEAIGDQTDRARYMELAVNRDVTRAFEKNVWPPLSTHAKRPARSRKRAPSATGRARTGGRTSR